MSIGGRAWHCWTVDCQKNPKSWSVFHAGKMDPGLLNGTREAVTGERGDCMHMGDGLDSSLQINSKCQGFMSLTKWRMGCFCILFFWEEFVWMSILCHKGIASLMLNLLWLMEKLQTYWIRIWSPRGLAMGTKNLRKHCTKPENLESTIH